MGTKPLGGAPSRPQDPFDRSFGQQVSDNPMVQRLVERTRGLGGAIGNLMGAEGTVDNRSQRDQMVSRLKGVDLSTLEGKESAAKIYGEFGLSEASLKMADMVKSEKAELAAKERQRLQVSDLSSRAEALGLDNLSESIVLGSTSIEDASDKILKEELKKREKEMSYPSKLKSLTNLGYNIQDIDTKLLKSDDGTYFNSMVGGKEGKPKFYTDSEGTARLFNVIGKSGKSIYDFTKNRLLTPQEISQLSPAPLINNNKEIKGFFDTPVGEQFAEDFAATSAAAKDARLSLDRQTQQASLMKEGASFGFFEPIKQPLARAAAAFGFTESDFVTNSLKSRRLVISAVQDGIDITKALKGAISDREFGAAQKVAAGDVESLTLDDTTVKATLELRTKARIFALEQYNKELKVMLDASDLPQEVKDRQYTAMAYDVEKLTGNIPRFPEALSTWVDRVESRGSGTSSVTPKEPSSPISNLNRDSEGRIILLTPEEQGGV
jgi:hypothetical protein